METEQLYEAYQSLLFSLAYRILGSVMDAEDIVHDVFISLNNIEDVQSIEKMKESISTAYLLLLQQLSEAERVVFILREVFGYDYREIASIVDKSSANCRKIFQRARKSILDKPKQSKLSTKKMAAYVEKFVSSLQCGDAQGMLEVLKTDAILKADGGGKATTAIHPIYSADRIMRLFFGIGKKFPGEYNVDYKIVNGAPGVLVKVKNKVTYVLSFTFENEKIANIYMMVNPEKLIHLNIIV
ncbi:sigma factor-like helix-turn-helix DNA-binding protein [Bacillus wiedmannii]|uniref:sigma factor-like helix-turn-helix DNA-binding protein n=1 Tax=Bacillus wiedmannii TaxID=1890302 RepID=UPI002E1C7C2E|nr:sigma factor-like helix-turn-helix DNA-binding protein [Bacillus wiedmannii]